ncbi:MAG: alpha/beta hydrolase [Micropepsaceae bacterium]
MTVLATNGADIFYSDQGTGDGVVLVHGFAASAQENWIKAGWVTMLTRANRRVVCIDLRGHGQSSRLHDPGMYSLGAMADDVIAVVEHLQIKKPDLVGFSLGARVTLEILARRSERFLLGILCGVGDALLKPRGEKEQIALAEAFDASSADALVPGIAKRFRQFAEAQGQDLKALAACARGLNASPVEWTRDRLGKILNEILVVAGSGDELAGSAPGLASAFPNAKGRQIPGCGHMDCLTQPMFKGAVMDFLAGIPV